MRGLCPHVWKGEKKAHVCMCVSGSSTVRQGAAVVAQKAH